MIHNGNFLVDGILGTGNEASGGYTFPLAIGISGNSLLVTPDGTLAFGDSRLSYASQAPVTDSSDGSPGQIEWDSNYLYICVAQDTWKRIALADFLVGYVKLAGDTMTGQLVGIPGSASVPSIATGFSNTGIFSPAADTHSIATSGAERIRVYPDGGVQIGGAFGTSPGAGILRVSANDASTMQAIPTGTLAALTGSTGVDARLLVGTYGTGAKSAISGRSARGTVTSPTASQAGDIFIEYGAWGYGTSSFSASPRASMQLFAAENWTNTAQGTRIGFLTTATGGTVTSEKIRIWGDGSLQVGGTFTAALGAGALSTSGNINSAGTITAGSNVSVGSNIVQGPSTRRAFSATSVVVTTDYDAIAHGANRGTIKYLVHLDDGTNIRTSEILASYSGSTVSYTESTPVTVGSAITGATWSVEATGGNIVLRLTRTAGSYNVKVTREILT